MCLFLILWAERTSYLAHQWLWPICLYCLVMTLFWLTDWKRKMVFTRLCPVLHILHPLGLGGTYLMKYKYYLSRTITKRLYF